METSSSSDSEEDVMIALACNEIEQKPKPRFWVHEINLRRETFGEFHQLFPDVLRDDEKFFNYYRMSVTKFYELINLLPIRKQNTNFRKAISPEERLAVTLKFLGYGDSFSAISFSYRLGETTVRDIIYDTCQQIWSTLASSVMPTPTTEQWKRVEEDFCTNLNFPNCIGAIIGKHIVFKQPRNSRSNYKKEEIHSVLLALVDTDYRFTSVDVGAYGNNGDRCIFRSSKFGRQLLENQLNIPKAKILPNSTISLPHVILGDEAFPLMNNIMRPYPEAQTGINEGNKIYNYRHTVARRVTKKAFGIMTKKFKIFLKKFNIAPKHLDIIILACIVLHNFLQDDTCAWLPGEFEEETTPESFDDIAHFGGNFQRAALSIREQFKEYFISDAGRAPMTS